MNAERENVSPDSGGETPAPTTEGAKAQVVSRQAPYRETRRPENLPSCRLHVGVFKGHWV